MMQIDTREDLQSDKKIAVQFFGHLRTFRDTFPYFAKNIVEVNRKNGYDVDVFIHTWNELDHSSVTYRNHEGKPLTDKKLQESDIEFVKTMYQPKAMLIEPQLAYEDVVFIEKLGSPRSKRSCYNNSYTIYKVNELRNRYEKEYNTVYDWVITTRLDILFMSPFDITQIFQLYTTYNFQPPSSGIFYASAPYTRGNVIDDPQFVAATDLIYLATPQNMDKATQIYPVFEENMKVEDFYSLEGWWYSFWVEQGLIPYSMDYIYFRDFWVVFSPISKFHSKQRILRLKTLLRKIEKEVLSLLPYCFVRKRIKRLAQKITKAKKEMV